MYTHIYFFVLRGGKASLRGCVVIPLQQAGTEIKLICIHTYHFFVGGGQASLRGCVAIPLQQAGTDNFFVLIFYSTSELNSQGIYICKYIHIYLYMYMYIYIYIYVYI